jgi:AcrR family transcriptional regulator
VSETTERRTQQSRRAETERRLLDSATALIAEQGLRGFSLAKVGESAGYSRGIVNHHFGSKSQLLEAVVRRAQQFDVPETDGSALDELLALAQGYLSGLRSREPATMAFLLLWSEAVGSEPTLAPLFAERDESFRAQLADIIRRGIGDGSVRTDAKPTSIAIAIVGLLRGTAMQLLSSAADEDADNVAAEIAQLIGDGLSRRPTRARG